MNNPGNRHTGNLAVVNPFQTHGTVIPVPPEETGPRVLELASILQTTLDVEQQILLLGREIQRYLAVDGLHYELPGGHQAITFGREGAHRATYDMKLEATNLGSIRAYRDLPFAERELRSLENLLCSLVYPLRNALMYKQAVELASRDPLTGCGNRSIMDSALEREIGLAKRQGLPMAVLVIDIDHFKRFNDSHGHAFGDDVLVAVAQGIATTIRHSDLLFRYGGEEFVVLASHTGTDGAMLLAERVRANIAAINTIRGRDVGVTVSIGAASLAEGDTAGSLFERADAALYAAKDAGRNRCQRG